MFLTKIVGNKVGKRVGKQLGRLAGRKPIVSAAAMKNAKVIAGVVAIAGAMVPIVLAVRKQLGVRAVRGKLAQAKEAARKIPHAAKPRKARRIARHLAKTLGPAAGTA